MKPCKNCGKEMHKSYPGTHATLYAGCGRSDDLSSAEWRATFGPHATYAEPEDD